MGRDAVLAQAAAVPAAQRFELLLEHTDIPIYVDDLKEWK